MPTYQYACTKCAHELEVVQSFTDDPLTECPVCAGRLRKVFSAVGVVFKGSGFYRTDSRAKTDATAGDGATKTETTTDSKSESKSESKSAASTNSSSGEATSSSSSSSTSSSTTKAPAAA